MSDDEPIAPTTAPDGEGLDEVEDEELPSWIYTTLESARAVPGASKRMAALLPTLTAAWRAGRSAVTLSSALRKNVGSEDPFVWPQELSDEFEATLSELTSTLPTFDETVPLAADIIELTERFASPEMAKSMALDSLTRLERVGEKAVRAVLETAFFAPDQTNTTTKSRNLRRLFLRLESLFDRAFYLWLSRNNPDTES